MVTLLDLIECLGTTPSEFSKRRKRNMSYIPRCFFEKIDEVGNSIQWIVPNAQQNQMEPLLVVVQPKEQLQEDKPHEGEEVRICDFRADPTASWRQKLCGKIW